MAGLWVKAGPMLIKKHASTSDTRRARPRQVLGVSAHATLKAVQSVISPSAARNWHRCLRRWDAEKHEVVQYRLERDRGIFCQGIAQGKRRQFGDKPILQRPPRARWHAQPRLVQWRQRV